MNISIFKKKFINFNSTFTKLIISYILLTFVILNISTFALYQGYKNQITQQSNIIYEKLLKQANYYTQNTLSWSKTFVYQLYLDEDIYKLMYGSDKNPLNEVSGNSKILQAASVVPLTQSIYIYNNNKKKFYSSIGINSSVENFFDQDIVSILKNSKETFSAQFIPRKITIPNKSYEINVLTVLLASTKVSENGLPEGAIVLNLNASEIGNYFKDISNGSYDLFAIDSKGTVILNSNTSIFYEDISSKDYIKKILNSKNNQGTFIAVINNKPSIINYITSERFNLKFINITPYDTLLGSMSKMIRLLLILFVILFAVGIVFAYIISKKIYSPIDKIVKYVRGTISSGDPLEKNENKNELDYLSFAITKILNASLSLKNLSMEDSIFIKQRILKDLLLNSLSNIKEIGKKLTDLNIDLNRKNLIVYVLRIDSYKKFTANYPKEDLEVYRYAMTNIALEITGTKYRCEGIDMDADHIAIILNTGEEPLSQSTVAIIDLIENIQENIFNYLDFSVSAGIGSFANDITELSKSYKWAYEYTNYKIKYGPNSILYYDKVIPQIKENYKYPEDKEKLLFDTIKSSKIEDIEIALCKMLDELLNYRYMDMVFYMTQLSMNSKKFINTLTHIGDENLLLNLGFFRENIDDFETTEEIKNWLMASYKNALLQLNENKCNKKEKLIEKVIAYIELNYGNPALSPELLADYVKISPNYLRTIFKETINKSLSTYIMEYRFEKAKFLLETTELAANEISTKIGFPNANYFYTSFKKFYGISPTEYRKSLTLSNNQN